MNKFVILFASIISISLLFSSCKKDPTTTPEQIVETTLNSFVATLVSNPPTSADVSNSVKQ
jgi:hypothetical protein